jgi:Zn-dependent protease
VPEGICGGCGAALRGGALACPLCGVLVHAAQLKLLAASASSLEDAGDLPGALDAWRRAGMLLPSATKQLEAVDAHRARLAPLVAEKEGRRPVPGWAKALGPVGVALVFLLGKGKLLLLGFAKLGTLLSMVASVGVYATAWGLPFAALLVLCIYVHEMGHVAALRAAGMAASAPMFVPGFGAFVRLSARPPDRETDARIGLAGPVWGLGAALACYGLGKAFPATPVLLAAAQVGAQINLLNLIPVWQLDGARGFAPLSKAQRLLLVALALGLLALGGDGVLVLVGLLGAVKVFEKDASATGSWPRALEFAALLLALSLVAKVVVPAGAL